MNEFEGKSVKLRSMRNYSPLRQHHYAALAEINNLFIEAFAIINALKFEQGKKSFKFQVPSTGGKTSVVERSPSQLHDLIENARLRREYERSLVLLISVAEA